MGSPLAKQPAAQHPLIRSIRRLAHHHDPISVEYHSAEIKAHPVVTLPFAAYNNCRLMSSPDKRYLNFLVDPALLKRLDDFRYQRRFPTRAAAIKWLLKWGAKTETGAQGRRNTTNDIVLFH